MIARAPGKLFLTGAYAVLEGAPAIVFAVDRFVEAREGSPTRTSAEVAAVARRFEAPPPLVDTRSLEENGQKLGLGSSAAAAVATAGFFVAREGFDLDDRATQQRVLSIALAAHAEVQPRGSGADVAASTFGGVVSVVRREPLEVESLAPLSALVVRAFATRRPARTSDVLDRLEARRSDLRTARALASIVDAAHDGARAYRAASLDGFLDAVARHVHGLSSLGAALDLPLVPPEVTVARRVLDQAQPPHDFSDDRRSPVLLPSGAGGGDTVLWLGARAPTDDETRALEGHGLIPLRLSLSMRGVHCSDASDADRP